MQTTSVLFMVRPAHFGFNQQTAASNAFQQETQTAAEILHLKARQEFDNMVEMLRAEGIEVLVLSDVEEVCLPDAVFPNNWVSFHLGIGMVLYPMEAENRRLERRSDLENWLHAQGFSAFEILDLTRHEQENRFLEGTGSLVLDRENKLAFAAISSRTNPELVEKWCTTFGYEAVLFHAADSAGKPVYHTNVLMAIGEKLAVVCLEAIAPSDRAHVSEKLTQHSKELIIINLAQMSRFAGNMLELKNKDGQRIMVMSAQAKASLNQIQLAQICQYDKVVSPAIPTIEQHGGGSVRCMMAEVFLTRQTGLK